MLIVDDEAETEAEIGSQVPLGSPTAAALLPGRDLPSKHGRYCAGGGAGGNETRQA